MLATIITIGDELLIGQTIDTNSAWIGQQLNAIGIKVHEILSVSDDANHIKNGLDRAATQSSIVLITGGLGPTKDDITKKTLRSYFHAGEVFHEPTFERIRQIFEKRGKSLLDMNRAQAMVPDNCVVLDNERGTAPGMWFESGGVIFVSMPGVPYEMKHLMIERVLPRLQQRFGGRVVHRNIMTVGIGESALAQLLDSFEQELPNSIKLAYLPDLGIVKLRLSAYGVDEDTEQLVEEKFRKLAQLVAPYTYANSDISLEAKLGEICIKRKLRIAFAESCTGGYAGHLVTSVPGSSQYFEGSTVTYSYAMKQQLLGVNPETLAQQGAVSETCVREMLEGLFRISKADYGVAISGIAGPDGGTPEKPVGTVCFAIGSPNHIQTRTLQFFPRRMENIRLSAITALNLLRQAILTDLPEES
ncbi:MAG: CinA family nicotinamide mononucleotide deamidase-related protein [Chitinophagales bacterium]